LVDNKMNIYDPSIYKQIVLYYEQTDALKNESISTSKSRTISSAVKSTQGIDHSV